MFSALKAGAAYFAIVFTAGFVLGTLRVLAIAPALGEWAAVLLEIPIILILSWLVCGWLIRYFDVPRRPAARIVMGVFAFALLMAAEFGLSVLLFGNPAEIHFALYASPPRAAGLAGQVVFALFPLIRWRTG